MLQCLDAAFHNADCEDVLRNAPLLAELSWHRSMGTANLPSVRSKTLTKLAVTGDSLSVVQFISILQNCPLLADLTCVLDRKDIHDPAPLTFANLESLRFSWPSPHALDLPTLSNLARLGCDLSSDPEVTGSFLRRSECVIHELESTQMIQWTYGEPTLTFSPPSKLWPYHPSKSNHF
jgi:hypothetical protein